MTPAAAEMLLIGILAGFFVSGVVQQLAASRRRGLDEETLAELERAVEQAVARKIAEGGFAVAAPAAAVAGGAGAATAVADPTADDGATDAAVATATTEAP